MNKKNSFLLDKVLVVEDDDILRHNIASILEIEGLQVYVAANVMEAKKLLKTKRISLILSDWMLPYIDGLELLKFVKSSAELNHLPFIFLTAKSTIEDKLIALELMADDFISKPFLSQEIMLKCRNHIESRKNLLKTTLRQEDINNSLSRDQVFINQVKQIILENVANENLCTDDFTNHFSLSASAIQKNTKRITGKSIFQLVLEIRLIMAKELILKDIYQISEVMNQCGFSNHNYFSKKFKEEYGVLPNKIKKHGSNKS
jgi:DNA-binding response OmpR family regulator